MIKEKKLKNYIFQEDGDPTHTSKYTKKFKKSKKINCYESWPPFSPDLNPIENMWAILKRDISNKIPKKLDQLEDLLVDKWAKIDIILCRKLIFSMPKRLQQVIDNKGGHTKY